MRILSTPTWKRQWNSFPTKQRTKSRVPWETLAGREKRADVKTASNTNALKLKKAQND